MCESSRKYGYYLEECLQRFYFTITVSVTGLGPHIFIFTFLFIKSKISTADLLASKGFSVLRAIFVAGLINTHPLQIVIFFSVDSC